MSLDPAFRWTVRVYWEDTDAGGVVYHAAYLRFLERGRSELLRSIGIEQRELAAARKILFAVRRIAVRFLRPARLDDRLDVLTRIERIGPASVRFAQRIERGKEAIAAAEVDAACLCADDFRPLPIPEDLRHRIASVPFTQ